jgi:RNA polymerase sigma factor (TIGR02999 family)
MTPSHDVTQLLKDWSDGHTAVQDTLMPLVYDELRRLARNYLASQRRDHTLQATALVHEAFLRMVDTRKTNWRSRLHFYRVAARAMRQILIDHARAHNAAKRGGLQQKLSLEEAGQLATKNAVELVALNSALENLTENHPRESEVVELKFFGGLNTREISEVLQVSEKTVLRDWNFAKLWLCRKLSA